MPKCTFLDDELKIILTNMTTNIMSDSPTGYAIDKLCGNYEYIVECYDDKMEMVKKCLRNDGTFFNSDGLIPFKRFLENMCKEDGFEIKSMLIHIQAIFNFQMIKIILFFI